MMSTRSFALHGWLKSSFLWVAPFVVVDYGQLRAESTVRAKPCRHRPMQRDSICIVAPGSWTAKELSGTRTDFSNALTASLTRTRRPVKYPEEIGKLTEEMATSGDCLGHYLCCITPHFNPVIEAFFALRL